MIRTEAELKNCIETLEKVYPPGKMVYGDPVGNYALGALAGLKVALGEYPTFAEIDMEDFFNSYLNDLVDIRMGKIKEKLINEVD